MDIILLKVFSWAIATINLACLVYVLKLLRKVWREAWAPLAILTAVINLYWALFYGIIEITGTPYTVEMGTTFVRPGLLMTSTVLLVSVIIITILVERRKP